MAKRRQLTEVCKLKGIYVEAFCSDMTFEKGAEGEGEVWGAAEGLNIASPKPRHVAHFPVVFKLK